MPAARPTRNATVLASAGALGATRSNPPPVGYTVGEERTMELAFWFAAQHLAAYDEEVRRGVAS